MKQKQILNLIDKYVEAIKEGFWREGFELKHERAIDSTARIDVLLQLKNDILEEDKLFDIEDDEEDED